MQLAQEPEPCGVVMMGGELVGEVVEPVLPGGVIAPAGRVHERLREI